MKTRFALVLGAALALLTSSHALAQDGAPDAGAKEWLAQPAPGAPAAVGSRPEGPSTLRMAALLLVVGALGGAAFYMKRKRSQVAERHGSPELAVVSTARLGPKSHLVLASVSGRLILLGVSDTSVRKLAWIKGNAKQQAADADGNAEADRPFSKVLRDILDEPDRPHRAAEPPAPEKAPDKQLTIEPRRSLLVPDTPARMYSDAAPRRETPAAAARTSASAAPERRSVPTTDLEGQVLGLARARKRR
jgi:flagellar biogenesis protein FliO